MALINQSAKNYGGRCARPDSRMLLGIAVSAGIAEGPAFVCEDPKQVCIPRRTIAPEEIDAELQKLDAAAQAVEKDLLALQTEVRRRIGDAEARMFEAQILVLQDAALRSEILTRCVNDRINVEAAVADTLEKFAQMFAKIKDPYFRERSSDLRDVGNRILDVLLQRQPPACSNVPPGSVVVTADLLPSTTARMDLKSIGGLVLEKGGQTSHTAILTRSLGIPAVIRVPEASRRIKNGDQLLVDGLSGRVFLNPSPSVHREYDKLRADFKAHQTALGALLELPAVTADGVPIKLCANIGKSADAETARLFNADGIGLYRTEFVFLVHDHFPTEEEQYQVYRLAADRLKDRAVTIRVLDIGSDKLLPYFPLPAETNPSLGQRGTRLLLKHPEILKTQLRAILRLSATHPVSVLFPMIGGLEELAEAKRAVEEIKRQLAAENQTFNPRLPVGAMIETPAAAVLVRRLAKEVDFLSVGTNDLVQYLLTTDRLSAEVAPYYEPLHPAVLQVLASLATVAQAEGKKISVCGEMAGNPAYTRLLLGLGFRNLSVAPGEILEIKKTIRSTALHRAETLAKEILDAGTISEVKNCWQRLQG